MKHKAQLIMLIVVISLITYNVLAQQIQRFPKPEFESGYQTPLTQVSKIQPVFFEYLDMFVLVGCMALMTWLVLKKRSRKAVFWLTVFSLLYFGFYREGCICPVGSVQNISMAIFNPGYVVPLTAIVFFIVPIIFTLFFGRTFCAGVCPLGAIQDLFAVRPVSLKPWIRYVLGLIPVIYLGLAVLFSATGTDFIVCRYDPFISFFRINGSSLMFFLGAALLLTGIFIARPYCRFFCPYGVILNFISRFSRKHVSITPSTCINCKLCENACPYDAIDKPEGLSVKNDNRELVKKLIIYCLITPALVVVTGWTASKYHEDFAEVNFKVRLAHELTTTGTDANPADIPTEVTTFRSSGQPLEALRKEVDKIIHRFNIGSWIVGGFLGLIIGLTLARLTIYRYKDDYQPNRGNCLSCARCVDYCPVGKEINNEMQIVELKKYD